MLVDDYSPQGKCSINQAAEGTLYVSTVGLSMDFTRPFQTVEFRVAILNNETNTIWSYSEETFTKIDLKKVIEKCKVGDDIIIMTVDKRFSLPHNVIEIAWGC